MANQHLNPNCLDSLASGVGLARDMLKSVKIQFESNDSPETRKWCERIQLIEDQCTAPPAIVGVVGSTGVGKSKTINALLKKDILPTSDLRACTAAPVEVLYNEQAHVSLYRAEVEFITIEEWREEIQFLHTELLNEEQQLDWNAISTYTNNEDYVPVKLAYDKVTAICPEIAVQRPPRLPVGQLLSRPIVELLGRKSVINSNDLDEFRLELDRFTGGTTGKTNFAFELWPLIRKIQVFDTAEVLQQGLRLVDLPGVQDNNAARAAVAEKYLKQCSCVLVVAPIVRAQSDKIALDFLNSYIADQLHMNGALKHVAFVCTKTDESLNDIESTANDLEHMIIPVQEQINQLQKEKSDLEVKQQLTRHELEQRQKSRSSQRSRSRSSRNSSRSSSRNAISGGKWGTESKSIAEQVRLYRQLTSIGDRRSEIEARISDASSRIRRIRMQYRNNASRATIQNEFLQAIARIKSESEQPEPDSSDIPPKVFCVCSQAYLEMQRGNPDSDVVRRGFLDEADTGIPELCTHFGNLTVDLRVQAFARFINAIDALINSLKLFSSDHPGHDSARDGVLDLDRRNTDKFFARFDSMIDNLIGQIMVDCGSSSGTKVSKLLANAKIQATQKCGKICKGWKPLKGNTLRAIFLRSGAFTGRKNRSYNFNRDLALPFTMSLSWEWSSLFNNSIAHYFDVAAADCKDQIKKLGRDLCERLTQIGTPPNSLLLFSAQTNASVMAIQNGFDDAKRTVLAMRDRRLLIRSIIREQLTVAYSTVAQYSGPGMQARMYRFIEGYLDTHADVIFAKVAQGVQENLMRTLQNTRYRLKWVTAHLMEERRGDYGNLYADKSEEFRMRQAELRAKIRPIIAEFEAVHLKTMRSFLQDLGYKVSTLGKGDC